MPPLRYLIKIRKDLSGNYRVYIERRREKERERERKIVIYHSSI